MTLIIAEIGSSPMPEWDFDKWCDAVAGTGADAVKVQLFSVDVIYPPHMREDMRPREFPRERLPEFVRCAHAHGLQAGASVFDAHAVEAAAEWCDWLKLAASQHENDELIKQALTVAFTTKKRLYRSMPVLDERHMQSSVVNLGVVPEYPASMVKSLWVLFKAANFLRRWASAPQWGWSSHTLGQFDCVLAAELGASVIEKHMALTPDDCEAPHSLLPNKFKAMVAAVRKVTK